MVDPIIKHNIMGREERDIIVKIFGRNPVRGSPLSDRRHGIIISSTRGLNGS